MILKEYIKAILLEGRMEAPPHMVDAITSWATEEIENYKKQSRIGPVYGLSLEKKFPIDLRDWKYGNILDDYLKKNSEESSGVLDYVKELIRKKKESDENFDPQMAQDFLDSVLTGLGMKKDFITVKLSLANTGYDAQWQPAAMTLYIHYYAGQSYTRMREAIEHELIHMGQDILSKVKNAKAGIPQKKRKTGGEHKNIEDYYVDDIEFYPTLHNEIMDAKRNNKGIKDHIKNSKFFKALRSRDIDKYKKAVRELSKALLSDDSL